MNNKRLIRLATLILLSSISLCSYATPHNVAPTPQPQGYSIHSIDSGRAALSSTSVIKRKRGYVVMGDARIKTLQRHILRLPGYITIELKSANGEMLESIKARFNRKFSTSKVARFSGMLKTTPPTGSVIVVKHNS